MLRRIRACLSARQASVDAGRFRALFQSEGVGVNVVGRDGHFREANEAFRRMVGYTAEELASLGPLDLTHPDDRQQSADLLARLRSGDAGRFAVEKRYVRRDGSVLWGAVAVTPFSRGAEVAESVAVVSDITARREAEEALARSSALLASTLNASPVAMLTLDLDGVVLGANPATERVFGWSEAELLGGPLRCIPDERRREHLELLALVGSGESVSGVETERCRKDGTMIDVSVSAAPIRAAGGDVIGLVESVDDITERLAAERALRQSERRHRLIVEQAMEGIWLIDERELTTFVNRRMAEMLGYEPEEMLDKSLFAFMAQWQHESARRNLERRRAGIAELHDFELRHRDGRPVWVSMSTSPLTDDDGVYCGALAVVTDVTERRELERRQRELAAIVEHTGESIVNVDAETARITFWNAAAERLYGWTAAEAVGQAVMMLQPPEHREERAELFRRVCAGETFDNLEVEILDRDGRRIDVLLTVSPVRDEAGEVVAVSGIATDISARKRTELALRESERRFRTLVAQLPVGVFVADAAGHATFVNRRLLDVSGMSADELRSERWMASVHPDDRGRVQAEWAAFVRGDGPYQVEHRVIGRDDRVGYVVVTATSLRDGEGAVVGYLGTVHDVTEQREIEQRMAEAQKLESLGVLAGGIAHDFNNLLVGVLGNAALALERLPADAPGRELVLSIQTAAQRAAELTSQMLAYSGRGQPRRVEPVHLGALVRELGALLESSISKRAHLDYRLATGLPPVEADSTQLRQLVMNLITNASDALGSETGVVTVRTSAVDLDHAALDGFSGGAELAEGRYVLLEIVDDGCGMSPETLGRIFDPFFTTKGVGRGLGLAAARGIVSGHGGAIRVVSAPGSGSSFEVVLPVATAPARSGSGGSTRDAVPVGLTGRVLVVDDEEVVRSAASAMLADAGLGVVVAESAEQALDLITRDGQAFDAVLLDLLMPGLGGVEAYARLRRLVPHLPVVVTSGYDEPDVLRGLRADEQLVFVHKPYTYLELVTAIQTALQRRAVEATHGQASFRTWPQTTRDSPSSGTTTSGSAARSSARER